MILSALLQVSSNAVSDWAHSLVHMQCTQELCDLRLGEHDWQFKALHVSLEQIKGFQIDHIVCEIEQDGPRLLTLLDALLSNT